MKHKVGDKVKIKTWDQMVSEFGGEYGIIRCDYHYLVAMENGLRNINSDRIITIKEVCNDDGSGFYYMKEVQRKWSDDMIKCLEKGYCETCIPISISIQSRFEMMDFDD